jgi:hypothetical protein
VSTELNPLHDRGAYDVLSPAFRHSLQLQTTKRLTINLKFGGYLITPNSFTEGFAVAVTFNLLLVTSVHYTHYDGGGGVSCYSPLFLIGRYKHIEILRPEVPRILFTLAALDKVSHARHTRKRKCACKRTTSD